jgi:hypothetical protein
MTQDDDGSAPMLGSQEPVAWRAFATDGSEAVYSLYEQARAAADDLNWSVEPLYRSPTLTDEEREAIAEAAGAYNDNDDDEECAKIAATLHGILKRLG